MNVKHAVGDSIKKTTNAMVKFIIETSTHKK